MLPEEDEYIAESRDPTPEPTHEEFGQADLESKDEVVTPIRYKRKEERVPDMQLGKCRYVRLHDNVNYVAAAICLRGSGDEREVLLIQEAKKTCHGKWYMPAGRVEAGETLEESVKRETLEETGYNCEVKQLLSMQVQGSGWYRFAFYVEITGGDLKTTADAESLCAQWFPVRDVKAKKMPLRGRDFVKLVDEACAYNKSLHPTDIPPMMPLNINIPGLFIEFMIVRHNLDGSRTEVLAHRSVKDESELADHDQPFPTVEFGFEYFFAMVISKCYRHLLEEGANVVFSPSHVTRVKCHPAPEDSLQHGLAVRLYCLHKKSARQAAVRSPSRYHWLPVESAETRQQLRIEKEQYKPTLHML